MIEEIKQTMIRSLSAKLVATVVAAFALAGLGILYWGYDSAYLSAFGVGPEIYNRPFFSSRLINVWLFIALIKPLTLILIFVCIVISIIATAIQFNPKKSVPEKGASQSGTHPFLKLLELFINNSIPAIAIIMVTFTILTTIANLLSLVTKEAKNLAQKQINAYVTQGKCIDAFEDGNIGCYEIEGAPTTDNLVILNDSKTIIFLSKKISATEGETLKDIFLINLLDKTSTKITSRKLIQVAEEKPSK